VWKGEEGIITFDGWQNHPSARCTNG